MTLRRRVTIIRNIIEIRVARFSRYFFVFFENLSVFSSSRVSTNRHRLPPNGSRSVANEFFRLNNRWPRIRYIQTRPGAKMTAIIIIIITA